MGWCSGCSGHRTRGKDGALGPPVHIASCRGLEGGGEWGSNRLWVLEATTPVLGSSEVMLIQTAKLDGRTAPYSLGAVLRSGCGKC